MIDVFRQMLEKKFNKDNLPIAKQIFDLNTNKNKEKVQICMFKTVEKLEAGDSFNENSFQNIHKT
jgi:hypothetical protein